MKEISADQFINSRLSNDADQETLFQEKVQALADEVLTIIKELHQEQSSLVNSKLIAKKMFSRESVQKLLDDYGYPVNGRNSGNEQLKQSIDSILNRFAESLPLSVREHFSNLKEQYTPSSPENALDNTVKIMRKLFNSVSRRINELEAILQTTNHFLFEMELYIKKEISSVDGKYQDDLALKNSVFSDVRIIKQSFDMSSDIIMIKKTVFSKIAHITMAIEQKREQETARLKQTKNTLEEMHKKMSAIVYEAEVMRQRAFDTETESLRDNLTKLFNRKAYDKKVEETLANLNRYDITSSLLLFDLDNFKQINDNYGHRTGDLALKKIAQILMERLRKSDFIARYGGEEFVCILPHTNLRVAKEISEQIRSFIENTIFTFKVNKIRLTISAGVSLFRKSDNASTVFERADAAMYLGKKSGRNMVKTEDDIEEAGKTISDFHTETD